MSRYVVLEPPAALPPSNAEDGHASAIGKTHRPDAADRNGQAVFVRDGFSFGAFLFTVAWLLRHRLWSEAALTLALLIGLGLLDDVAGFGPAVPVLVLLLALLVGLEGPALRVAKLRRQGWTESAAFGAGDRDEAEIIYYAGKVSMPGADRRDGVGSGEDPGAGREVPAGRSSNVASVTSSALSAPGSFFDAARLR